MMQAALRTARLVALCAPVIAWAMPAAADPVAASTSVSAHSATVSDPPRIGASLDVGVPDGATASIVYRPWRALRAEAGLSHNLISLGGRGGLTYVPFSSWASPTLTVEYGKFAEGNANPLARMVSGDSTFSSSVLDRVGYQYGSVRLGLELGRKWFTFYIHAGVSRVNGTVRNLSTAMMDQSPGTTTSVSFSKDPTVTMWTVSANLGFVVYLSK